MHSTTTTWFAPFVTLIFFLFFILWRFIIKFLLKESGFAGLMEEYPVPQRIKLSEYKKLKSKVVVAQKVRFSGTLRIYLGSTHLLVKMLTPFAWGHRGALIPLDQITYLKTSGRWRFKVDQYDFAGVNITVNHLPDLIRALEAQSTASSDSSDSLLNTL